MANRNTKKHLPVLLLILLLVQGLQGQIPSYNIALIPDSLLKGANAVVRTDVHRLEISSPAKAVHTYKVAYTILNAKADHLAEEEAYYDKFNEVSSIEANLYDAMGLKIKSLKKSEIKDMSGMGGGTEVLDNRYKQFGFYHKTYPYTVEYEVTTKKNALLFLPRWYPISYLQASVQQSSMEVVVSPGVELQHLALNFNGQFQEGTDAKGNKVYTWQVKNLKPFTQEYASPSFEEMIPVLLLSLKTFEIDGYKGSYASWEDFGNFSYQLTKGKDVLPPPLKEKVQELTAGKQTTFEKVDALYRFMQQNTRYISIQLGIGGWMPFDASFVYTKKYGDCKALTNFMYSMLKEAGIPSIYTLVKSGRGLVRFQEKFPSQQFDHVILCVPNGTDSIWLECTSQSNPTGYLGSFTANRPVLLVMEKGSKLVRTPHYSLEQNYQNSTLQGRITPDGHLTGTIITNYGAMQSERVHGLIHHARPDEQKEYLAEAFDLGTYVINDYKYEERLKKYIPEVEERVQFDASHFAQVTGRRLLFTPNVLNKSTQRLTKDTARKYDVLFTYGYVDRDTVIIEVGENYAPEAMPKVATIESRFGRYKSEASFNNGKLVYVREMQRFEGRYPPEAYNELVAFLDAVNKADRARVVLVKPEG